MLEVKIKDSFGEVKTYKGNALQIWRDGNTIEVYYSKPIDNGSATRKVILAIASNPALVEIQETVKVEKPPRETDPFTKEALENRPDTPEEKALLGAYQAIEGKKKRIRRTKAQIEADNAAKQENKGEENV